MTSIADILKLSADLVGKHMGEIKVQREPVPITIKSTHDPDMSTTEQVTQTHIIEKRNIMLIRENSRKKLGVMTVDRLLEHLKEKCSQIKIPVDDAPQGSTFLRTVYNKYERGNPYPQKCGATEQSQWLPCPISNHFVGAAATAYSYHLPLRLKPDHIFVMMMQGFSTWLDLFGGAD